jgi:tetratricopeptide (TPR) repeat protein
MKRINIFILMLTLVWLASCKKYLEKEPKVQTDIQTADQLEALINNAAGTTTISSANLPYDGNNATMAYSTDDTEIKTDLFKNNPTAFDIGLLYYYVFDVTQVAGAASDAFWNGEYRKIFTMNVILSNIDRVTGEVAQKNRIKADAYFIRAYSYWNLVNYYCQPYAAGNMQSKGLPLKTVTDYTEPLKRASLQETYDFILSDIAQAQSLVSAGDVQTTLRWRVSKPAIDAFLSRFYLFTGDYDKSLQYANAALTSSTAKLVDYNTLGAGVPESYTNPAVTLKYSVLNDRNIVRLLNWDEFFYARFTYTSRQWFVPSTNLLSLYDTSNDLRYQLFMIPNGGRRFSVVTPSTFRYTFFYDGSFLPTGPTVAEVLLNKAEASARKGDVSSALTTVNLLRAKRLKTYVALTAVDKADALTKILQERRRELPFSFRWWDIRRFSVNDDASDDVTVIRNFFKMGVGTIDVNTPQTYTLPVKSNRYMVPINDVEINASQGQIEQNTY